MKVSYIVPCYNNEEFVHQSLLSIHCQRMCYPDIEIIVIDDGSTDDSYNEICKGTFQKKILRFERNYGVGAALNLGFKVASGDYLCFFAADDVILVARKTSEQVSVMKKTNADLSYYLDRYVGEDEYTMELVRPTFVPCRYPVFYFLNYIIPKSNWLLHRALLIKEPINSGSMMITRKAYTKYGGWAEDVLTTDYDLLLRYAREGAKFQPIPGAPILYRTHPGQCSNRTDQMSEGEQISKDRNTWKEYY